MSCPCLAGEILLDASWIYSRIWLLRSLWSLQGDRSRKHHGRVPASRGTNVCRKILGRRWEFHFWRWKCGRSAVAAAVSDTVSRQCAVVGSVRSVRSSSWHIDFKYVRRPPSSSWKTFFSNYSNEITAKRRKCSSQPCRECRSTHLGSSLRRRCNKSDSAGSRRR